ncbi:helix-turn-helix domain-containing protein [Kocuria rhizophila]|nr:helix-turn-helix domain-containing protein [Kocuria rhizophila]
MQLRDPKKLKRLMIVQDISQRELARAAGWKSHSYLGRLMSGKVTTLSTDPALRIAHTLGVGVEDLFLTKVSEVPGHDVQEAKTRKKAAA